MYLSKPLECTTPKVNPKVNHVTLVDNDVSVVVCGGLSSIVTNYHPQHLTLIIGRVVHMWGQGVCGKSLCLPHNFAVNLTLLLKKKSLL